MQEKIIQYLAEIEAKKDIKILLACETGSRAWGFPSPDSDYDVRLIYVHKKDWYLSLSEGKDSIDMMLENNDIDISGWELRKSLRLLHKSNPPLLERLQSSILYGHDHVFLNKIRELTAFQYSRIASIHHYLSMAKKITSDFDENEPFKLKKFFYALRSATACQWILEKETPPPIEFKKMLDGLSIDTDLLKRIDDLIALKATISESYMHQDKETTLFSFIKTCITNAESQKQSLPPAMGKLSDLNPIFRETIARHDH